MSTESFCKGFLLDIDVSQHEKGCEMIDDILGSFQPALRRIAKKMHDEAESLLKDIFSREVKQAQFGMIKDSLLRSMLRIGSSSHETLCTMFLGISEKKIKGEIVPLVLQKYNPVERKKVEEDPKFKEKQERFSPVIESCVGTLMSTNANGLGDAFMQGRRFMNCERITPQQIQQIILMKFDNYMESNADIFTRKVQAEFRFIFVGMLEKAQQIVLSKEGKDGYLSDDEKPAVVEAKTHSFIERLQSAPNPDSFVFTPTIVKSKLFFAKTEDADIDAVIEAVGRVSEDKHGPFVPLNFSRIKKEELKSRADNSACIWCIHFVAAMLKEQFKSTLGKCIIIDHTFMKEADIYLILTSGVYFIKVFGTYSSNFRNVKLINEPEKAFLERMKKNYVRAVVVNQCTIGAKIFFFQGLENNKIFEDKRPQTQPNVGEEP